MIIIIMYTKLYPVAMHVVVTFYEATHIAYLSVQYEYIASGKSTVLYQNIPRNFARDCREILCNTSCTRSPATAWQQYLCRKADQWGRNARQQNLKLWAGSYLRSINRESAYQSILKAYHVAALFCYSYQMGSLSSNSSCACHEHQR